ncbi:MAG: hypothetical protein AAB728_00060, partial [Patescibacteria group bacterium]
MDGPFVLVASPCLVAHHESTRGKALEQEMRGLVPVVIGDAGGMVQFFDRSGTKVYRYDICRGGPR